MDGCKEQVKQIKGEVETMTADARRKEREVLMKGRGGGGVGGADVELSVRGGGGGRGPNHRGRLEEQKMMQAELKTEQDQHLKDLDRSVTNLNDGANVIFDELKEQEKDLMGLEEDIDRASEKVRH